MKVTRLGAGLAALTLLVAGCSGGSGDKQEIGNAEGEVSAEGETLSLWIMEGTNPEAEPFFDELSTAFEEETGAELDVQFVPWADAHDKFVKSIAGGTTPDVAEVGTTWTPEFADAGALVDLTDAVSEAGLDDDLVSGLVEAGTVDDALYGMPWYSGVRSVVYRTDVFEKAGIEPPTTWDELVAAGEELKKAEPDMIPFPIAGDSEYGVYPFIWGNGGDVAVQDGDAWTSDDRLGRGAGGHRVLHRTGHRARALLARGDHVGRGRPLRRLHPRRRRDDDRRQLDAGRAGRGLTRPRGQDRRVPDPGPRRRALAVVPRWFAPVDLQHHRERRPGVRAGAADGHR